MSSTKATTGTTTPPAGVVFDHSGMPEEISYLGNISVSAAADKAFTIAGDLGRQEYGRIPLSAVGTAYGFVINAPTTAVAKTFAQAAPGSVSFGVKQEAGASALVFFVTLTGGSTLSGFVTLAA